MRYIVPQIDLVAFVTVYFITAVMFWLSYALQYTAVSYIFHWTQLFWYYSYSTYTLATLGVLAVMQSALLENQKILDEKKKNAEAENKPAVESDKLEVTDEKSDKSDKS